MKKYLLLLCLVLPIQAFAVEQWKAGEHYQQIADIATAKPEVAEVFSYWCPHCYRMEPFVNELKKRLPKGVAFNKVHANFMRFTNKQIQDDATRAMLVAKALGKEAELNAAIFNFIHKYQSSIDNVTDLQNIFAIQGVEAEQFAQLINSEQVTQGLAANNTFLQQHKGHIKGVPALIVNGKYLVKFAKGMTAEDQFALINWLTQLN